MRGADLQRFDLNGEQLWLQVRDGKIVRADPDAAPDLTFSGSAAALLELCRGTSDLTGIEPRLRVEGSRSARKLFAEMFPIPVPA